MSETGSDLSLDREGGSDVKLESLTRKRGNLKEQLTKFENFLEIYAVIIVRAYNGLPNEW